MKDYYDYHFERPYVVKNQGPQYYDLMELEPGFIDEIIYAFFPTKRNAEAAPTPAKCGKKQKSNKHAK